MDHPCHILCWFGLSLLLLDNLFQAWHQEPLRTLHKLLLLPRGHHMLDVWILSFHTSSLILLQASRSVDSRIQVDNHSEVHDSLVNSTLKSFNFHLNLSSVSFGVSIFIVILIILLSRRQNLAIARISAQILKQRKSVEMLMKGRAETNL